jgi:hypothetical protein
MDDFIRRLQQFILPVAIGGRMNRGTSQPPGTRRKNRKRRKAERQRKR